MEDDEGILIMVVKNKMVILEELFVCVLEEVFVLKVFKEVMLVDFYKVNEKVMELELQKVDLIFGLKEIEKKVLSLE